MAKANKQPKKVEVKAGMAKATALATRGMGEAQGGPLILQQDQVPEYLQTMQTARGTENVGTEDLVIPRLEIVQALSPAITEGDPGYIKGAKVGDLINSVTNQNYGNEVFVVPVQYNKLWLVWRDRKKGGGFRGAYPTKEEADDRVAQEGGKAEGYESIDTPTHLCLLVDHRSGSVDEIMVSMPRTKAKVSRQWNSMVKLAQGDRFSRIYRVSTQKETNPKGTFYNFVVSQSGFPSKPLYQRAEKLYEAVKSGQARTMDVTGFDPGSHAADADSNDM